MVRARWPWWLAIVLISYEFSFGLYFLLKQGILFSWKKHEQSCVLRAKLLICKIESWMSMIPTVSFITSQFFCRGKFATFFVYQMMPATSLFLGISIPHCIYYLTCYSLYSVETESTCYSCVFLRYGNVAFAFLFSVAICSL